MEDSKLSELRNKIDAIDDKLLAMLSARAELVLEVGKLKKQSPESNFIRSGREAKMLRELLAKNKNKLPPALIRSLWRSIISASLKLENGLKIALPAGADLPLHLAVIDYFGSFTEYKEYEAEDEILDSIDKHKVGVFTLSSGWWLKLAEKDHQNLKIFAKLSEGIFAVAKLDPEESGNDKTIAITHATTHTGHELATHGKVKLIEVSGFHRQLADAVVIGNYGL